MTDPRDKRDGDPPGPGPRGVLRGIGLAGGVFTRLAHVFVVFLLSQLVSTSSIAFLCALEPQPVLDFETRAAKGG
jgi:hypothetical protein